MHFGTTKALIAVVVAVLTFQHSAVLGEVHVSFLNDTSALNDTVGILTHSGCGEEAARVFCRIVDSYYAKGLVLDLSKFPERRGGFYSFPTMKSLLAALPHRLCDTDHPWDINCFDTVIVLASDKLSAGLQPDENYGPFMVSKILTNGEEAITFTATAREAFELINSQWYRDWTDTVIPSGMQDTRICLTAELFRWHLLPKSTTDGTMEENVWAALRSDWRRAALRFPQGFQVVLTHKGDLQFHSICTHHAGLLLSRGKGYAYLEKAGGKGPFVRLDFDDRDELMPWMSGVFGERERESGGLFVTFNDTDIVRLDSK